MTIEQVVLDEIGKLVPRRKKTFKIRDEKDMKMIVISKLPFMFINRTAAELYELCDGKRDIKEITEIQNQKYPDIPPEKIAADAIKTLRNMECMRLLRLVLRR
jgi:hypothetical protein